MALFSNTIIPNSIYIILDHTDVVLDLFLSSDG